MGQLFIPKDEHCGKWHSSPNSKCHASFGDDGTTASVSCYGDLVQMSQFLGAGHSGMFSIDQRLTEEPYLVRARAEMLEELSASVGTEFSFGLGVPWEFCPLEPPEVKWVNWRWPRYEYDTKIPNVKASFQYVVHDKAVFQQFVLTNSGGESVDFEYQLGKDMLLRDLDYLDSAYAFNEGNEVIYTRVSGPNGYGHVCVAALSKNDDPPPVDGGSNDYRATTGSDASKLSAGTHVSDFAPATNIGMNPRPANILTSDESKTQTANNATCNDSKRVEESDKIHTRSASVAAIINLFVNGQAVRIQNAYHEGHFVLEGKQATTNGNLSGTLEIVISYKLMLLPQSKGGWRRFLVSAQDADVSNILRKETERLWKGAGLSSICSLGLSFMEPVPSTSPVLTPTNAKSEAISDEQKEEARKGSNEDKRLGDDKSPVGIVINSEANNESVSTSLGHDLAQGKTRSIPGDSQHFNLEDIPLPSGTALMGSTRSHTEYLAWRHLEHILSNCAIPCSAQEYDDSFCPTPPESEKDQEKGEVIIALTCGDMSGHRVCTSAS